MGNALLSLGRADEAAASYRRALELEPAYAAVHNNLGHALLARGRLAEAMASCHRALEIKPDFAEAHNNLGNVLLNIGRLDDAEASYRRALEIKPDFADAHSNLGIALRLQGRTAQAEASCRRALELNPALAPAITVLADAQADKGQFAAAEDLYRRAIAIEPDLAEAWAGIAYLRKMTGDDAPWLAEAQRIVAKNPAPRKEVLLRYAIGKYFDDVKDFDQAFLHYQRANELTKLHRIKHDRQQLTQFIDELIQSYGREWVDQARIHGAASARPVFIVGVPRSGTSLAEQILASHPAVFGAGELTFWNIASATYQSTAPRGEVIASILSKLSTDYLRLLEEFSADALRVVDKMPTNFMFLGLIHAALPNARIIHMRRNPIDTCLSIYFQDFSAILSCANDLGDLAHYYAEYVRVMKHWHSILPAGAILDVPYEGLVDDQEAWSRKMLEFVGLPWDPKCLDFHQSSRSVVTASKWQVRQKISKSSVERWRNYAKQVGPLLTLLEQR
ncbi:MAG TPA: sulfotransferase [Steroidobacteraceae bacterium]|nr:sulfotransferase [Steroidobacteraceae bacterium]